MNSLKPLLVALAFAIVVCAIAKPSFSILMGEEAFVRRRNTWLALTVASFITPSFWLYVVLAVVIIAVAFRKEHNPAALYVFLLLAVPPLRYFIPGLMEFDHLRLLSLAILAPLAMRSSSPANGLRSDRAGVGLNVTDLMVITYAAIIFLSALVSITIAMREVVQVLVDILLPYFVLSRAVRSRKDLVDVMASFVLAAVILAPIAAFEFATRWLVFSSIEDRWGDTRTFSYLIRGMFLRAQATAGHSIVFGYVMVAALALWLSLRARLSSRIMGWAVMGLLILGAIVTLAKGPWVAAGAMLVVYLVSGPRAASRTLKGGLAVGVLAVGILMSPWAESVIDALPFVGKLDEGSVTYRAQLAEISWGIIKEHPWFGSTGYMARMEELRTGEGIIDIVNTYAGIALAYGLVGLGAFVGMFVSAAWRCFFAARRAGAVSERFALEGTSLVALIVATMVCIGTVSNYLSIPYIYFAFTGLAVAYARLLAEPANLVAGDLERSSPRAI